MPYLEKFNNIQSSYPTRSYMGMNSTAHILNAVIDALNTEDRLPRFLVLAVDMDVLRDLKNSDHILDKHINAVVNFVTRQVEILVRRKKSQIMEKSQVP